MPAPQSVHENGALAFTPPETGLGGAPGSFDWTLKMMLELGKRMPRITWFRLPTGGNAGACDANAVTACGLDVVITMAFSAASSALQ